MDGHFPDRRAGMMAVVSSNRGPAAFGFGKLSAI